MTKAWQIDKLFFSLLFNCFHCLICSCWHFLWNRDFLYLFDENNYSLAASCFVINDRAFKIFGTQCCKHCFQWICGGVYILDRDNCYNIFYENDGVQLPICGWQLLLCRKNIGIVKIDSNGSCGNQTSYLMIFQTSGV